MKYVGKYHNNIQVGSEMKSTTIMFNQLRWLCLGILKSSFLTISKILNNLRMCKLSTILTVAKNELSNGPQLPGKFSKIQFLNAEKYCWYANGTIFFLLYNKNERLLCNFKLAMVHV